MHMGRYAVGLAEAAVRRGAAIFENAAVTDRRINGGRHELTTNRGKLSADNVFLATGAYTTNAFGYFRRRIVPVGSFIIATRPLSEAEVAATMPGNRTCVTSLNVGNYFRLSPDNRLIFGGRARFSATSDQQSDTKSGEILRASLAEIFPRLAKVEIDYCWGGLVDMTKDRFPRAGYVDGLWYAMGYSGHGAQMATHMGMMIADAILGKADRNPVKGSRLAGGARTFRQALVPAARRYVLQEHSIGSASQAFDRNEKGARITPARFRAGVSGKPADMEGLDLEIFLDAGL